MQNVVYNFEQKNGTDANTKCGAVVRADAFAEHRADRYAVVRAEVVRE